MINTVMKKVVIYPGRFQPMLSHHAEVFKQLKSQFPDAEIYVGTSDKVEAPKSPFNFKEKQAIATAHGVPADHVLMAARPYHKDDYAKYFDENNTIIIFAVGEKDLDRFPFGNVDAKTGLDMTVKGEARPKYYQKINTLQADPRPMSDRGYITLAPTIMTGDEIASASAFRQALIDAPDETAAKQVFQKQFGNYDDKIFKLIYSKVTGANMSEQINIMRKLAGLPVQEAAPVAFNAEADAKAAKFLPTNVSSAKMSIANRFPKGADVNERLDPKDDNSLAVGQKLSDIMQLMNQKDIGIASLPKDLKQFVLDLTINAVKNMELKAGDDSPAYKDMSIDDEEDEFKRESVDLSSIRNEYGVEEAVPSGTIDSPATANYALKMVKALNDRFGGDYFETKYNKDGSVTIVKTGMWADEAARRLGRDPNRDPDLKLPGALTGKNFNDAIDPWYREFRGKGWRFDQPVNGSFTIAVTKQQGVAEAKDEEDEDDDSWIPSEDEFDQEIKHGYKGRTTEDANSESDMVLAKAGSGELDIYDVMTNPKTPAEATAAKIIQQMYDDVAIDHHLHPDDDFEKILDIVADQLDKDYGVGEGMGDNIDPVAGGSDHSMTGKPKSTKPQFKYEESVESTAGHAVSAALAELRKLAGI